MNAQRTGEFRLGRRTEALAHSATIRRRAGQWLQSGRPLHSFKTVHVECRRRRCSETRETPRYTAPAGAAHGANGKSAGTASPPPSGAECGQPQNKCEDRKRVVKGKSVAVRVDLGRG